MAELCIAPLMTGPSHSRQTQPAPVSRLSRKSLKRDII